MEFWTRKFPVYRQLDKMDCGPTCLRMISKYYGKALPLQTLKDITGLSRQGVSLLAISKAAEKIGLRSSGLKASYEQLLTNKLTPFIIPWNDTHFVVVVSLTKKKAIIADPSRGLTRYSQDKFIKQWKPANSENGTLLGPVLLFEPTPAFLQTKEHSNRFRTAWGLLFQYFRTYKGLFVQVFLSLVMASALQIVFPFITKSVVDVGINGSDLGFIKLVLFGQLVLFLGKITIEFFRSRVLLYISTRINLSILSDFWIKLMKLPVSYFDTKKTGDILQRIGDHQRIEAFLTNTALSAFFSLITLIVLSIVLVSYDKMIFLVFVASSIIYIVWVTMFLGSRRRLDHERFSISSRENSATMQLIYGMQEIRMNNAENYRRWEWERIQTQIYSLSFRSLSLSQVQLFGSYIINEGKNLVILYIAAKMVIEGQLTLGAMMAIQYILGQLSGPIDQVIGFIQTSQDAKISLERLNEIHELKDEEEASTSFQYTLPVEETIRIVNLEFSYPGTIGQPVLRKVNLDIPEGKTTAIVGVSGSGKTTLLKLLVKFYDNYEGAIVVGDVPFKFIGYEFWRQQCGVVLQDGFIFNDTIEKNITVNEQSTDYLKLKAAAKTANILEFIEDLPQGFDTPIGAEGVGLSSGQRQRILIARAVYKDPKYLFFDEATNALDTDSESSIMSNLSTFFQGRTVVIVAHRLSTVKNANNIVVLNHGVVAEQGTHEELLKTNGIYFKLVKNQLNLER